MMKFGVGQSVERKEDKRLVTGRGLYPTDVRVPGQTYAALLRSPHAHARLTKIDVTAARQLLGVHIVLTGADVAADKFGSPPAFGPDKNRDGTASERPPHPLLVTDVVRHVGDPIAFVVADSLAIAREAADMIELEFESLPAIVDTAAALEDGAPLVWPSAAKNLCLDWEQGDKGATEAAIASASHVATLDLINNRLVVNSMEPRAAVGEYDAASGRYKLTTCTQGTRGIRGILAAVFKLPEEKFRVITPPDVGGGFGMKGQFYAEMALVLWAAQKIGRAVKWSSDRSEAFLSDIQGRDHVTTARLALDRDGKFLGLHVRTVAAMGAYLSTVGPLIPTIACAGMHTGVYAIPAAYNEVKCVFTHTVPVDAYRGAGRPEAAYMIERLVDVAAHQLKIDPGELRRRNYITPAQMPYKTALGLTYDSGEFARNMDDARVAADWSGFTARRTAAARRGKLRGIGLAYYIETCAGPLLGGENVTLRVADGKVGLVIGTQASGQGHETAFAQFLNEKLEVGLERIELIQGDSDIVPASSGTAGSRSITTGGHATLVAADNLIEKGRSAASELLEVAGADIRYADGTFTVVGTDRRVTLFDVALAVRAGKVKGVEEKELSGVGTWAPTNATYPNGCHICEVELDPETGKFEIIAYSIVDDVGKVLNPMLLAGQIHGGVVQGAGQAIMENTLYDGESGQLLTASFMDYAMPRAEDVPFFNVSYNEVLCRTNPLGLKGAGEAGTVGACPSIVNAIVDALSTFGIKHLDMPLTAERVWRAIKDARASRTA
ncbi:MAG: xanthine dehydrogenase family protein molybdopterin-binding subunit [Alphaproteobacteria bacterium]|nr:xanthine dehydrogenase family protein molybdopterin-binding subunit [Alphaproteobacteria bacterium]